MDGFPDSGLVGDLAGGVRAAAVREVFEETGVPIRLDGILRVEHDPGEPGRDVRVRVLFTGSPVDVDGRPGKAESVYFVSPAGAKVFSSGTIRWALGLGAPGYEQDKFKIFNRNLLEHFLRST